MKPTLKEYEIHKIFGKNVQKIRTEKGISINELSKITKIKEQYLEKIENGTAIRLSTNHLFKIACALKVKPYELITDL